MAPIARLLAALALCAAATGSVVAAERGADVLGIVFSEVERRIIREYYGGEPGHHPQPGAEDKGNNGKGAGGGLPPGLAKRATLPPGLSRQIERNGALPPGLAKRDLPPDLDRRLPRHRDGIRRVVVDRDVVLIEEATGLVLDVIEGVLKEAIR